MRRWSALLVAAAIAGCGGDGDESVEDAGSGGGASATQAYVAEVDAICADANRKEVEIGAIGSGWLASPLFDDERFLSEFTGISRNALDRIMAVEPPAEIRDDAVRMTESIDRMVSAIEDRLASVKAESDKGRGGQVRRYDRGYSDLTTVAGSLGLVECQGLLI